MANPDTSSIIELLESTSIPHYTPADAKFPEIHANFVSNPALPLVIVRPQSASHVQQLVSSCVERGVDFVLRSGGHDLCGRSTVEGVVQIDLRDLSHVTVAADQRTAKIGGGILFRPLLTALNQHGLMAAVGSVGSVGYVGWSTLGGYGPYGPGYGLGVDQIVGATLANASGELIEADDEMLRGIRGGGGASFGVVVELEIKVYPLNKQILAGTIFYESSDIAQTITTYFTNFTALIEKEEIPKYLYLMASVYNIPGMGKTFVVPFFWNGPPETLDDARSWQAKVAGLATCAMEAVELTTPLASMDAISAMIPPSVFGVFETVSLTSFSGDAIARLARTAVKMPADPATAFGIHSLAACSPSTKVGASESVFRHREPHFMIELIGSGLTKETGAEGTKWAAEAREELAGVREALEGTYISLTRIDRVDLEKIYGPYLPALRSLKEKYDPKWVFRHAVPDLTT